MSLRDWFRRLFDQNVAEYVRKRQEPRKRQLLCMRLNEMLRVHPEQITMTCSQCHEQVGIYPSGQRILHQYPDTKIICNRCHSGPMGALAPGAVEERFESKWRD